MHMSLLKFTARLAVLTLLICLPVVAWAAQFDEVSADRPAEYMIYQYADISFVVKIDAAQAEFSAVTTGPDGAFIKESGVSGRRIGPVFQYLEADGKPRQLMIKVFPERTITRSEITLELIQLSPNERNSPGLARAYKLLSHGMERLHTDDTATWTSRVYSLRSAARAFSGLGMEEMRQWSEYYAAHLVLHQLGDEQTAIEFARDLQSASRRVGFEEIELAARTLESEALMTMVARARGENAERYHARLHQVLEGRIELSRQLGYRSELGRALYNDGIVFERQGKLEQAIERYQQALDATVAAGNVEFANEIRSTAAATYESQGSTSGAIGMLDDISGDLADSEDAEAVFERAESLLEKGRLLNRGFRFAEAVPVLEESLALQQGSGLGDLRGLTGLELSWAQFSLGQFEQALATAATALPRTPRSGNARVLARAYDSLAQISRHASQFRQMDSYREQQAGLVKSEPQRTEFLVESALDEWRRAGKPSSRALELLQDARRSAVSDGRALTGQRAALYQCLFAIELRGRGACSSAAVTEAHATIRQAGFPRLAVEADYLLAQLKRAEGNEQAARAGLGRLVDETRFYNAKFPGVLGAWYWLNRTELVQHYLELVVRLSPQVRGGYRDSSEMLLALEQVRLLEKVEAGSLVNVLEASDEHRDLMEQIGRQASAAPGGRAQVPEKQLHRQLERRREHYLDSERGLDSSQLERLLENSLKDQGMLLSYHFAADGVWVITFSSPHGARMRQLKRSGDIADRLDALRQAIATPEAAALTVDLDRLGSQLITPVGDVLRERVFLLATGPLNGFPFDALRYRGQFLAERREFVYLDSLAALADSDLRLTTDYGDRVFLAGNPQSGQELFSYRVASSREIEVVRDRFVGPGLNIVQGVALKRDEFLDERIGQATLIHLAAPGQMDLAVPSRSRLVLSDSGASSAGEFLFPADISRFELSSRLVVLSGTTTVASAASPFASRLGLVSDFLDAGVDTVLVATWPAGDTETADFMEDFYRQLERRPDVSLALAATRRDRINRGDGGNLSSWAGFQLHIR
jgi:CHAT domain-containing protein